MANVNTLLYHLRQKGRYDTMKLVSVFCGATWFAIFSVNAADTLFSDNFNNGLAQWTGKYGGTNSGVIVPDPLNSGHGGVLTFTSLAGSGDIFTVNTISSTQAVIVSFDYLGLAKPGSVAGDFGGAIGICGDLTGNNWDTLAATFNSPGVKLIDDGQWHSFQFSIPGWSGPRHLSMEDWYASGGVAGDSYFDNLRVGTISSIPEPSTIAFASFGLVCFFFYSRCSKPQTKVN